TGGAASFALLSGACEPPPAGFSTGWLGANVNEFQFFTRNPPNNDNSILIVAINGDLTHPGPDGEGGWTITPEPSSKILLTIALLAMGLVMMRKRTKTGLLIRPHQRV